MRERTFGVEIECGIGAKTYDRYYDDYEGEYIEEYYTDDDEACDKVYTALNAAGFTEWLYDIHPDGSGVEIPSPVLRGMKGLNELRQVLELLKRAGAWVSDSDGFHVHHGAEEFVNRPDLIERLVETWETNQDHIDRFVDPSRWDNYACPKWDNTSIDYLKQNGNYYSGRRVLNVSAIAEHGTIEFRQHEGTLDFDQAYSWIHFGQAFIENVLSRKRVVRCSDSADLLRKVGVAKKSTELLLARAAA